MSKVGRTGSAPEKKRRPVLMIILAAIVKVGLWIGKHLFNHFHQ